MEPIHKDDISAVAWNFGVRPCIYEKDVRVRALLQYKVRLNRAIANLKREECVRVDDKEAKRKQLSSKTKADLLDKIRAKFDLNAPHIQDGERYGPVRCLIAGVADSMIYLALLRRPTVKTAKAVSK